ncbi:MAG TPA: DUF167 family protein [Kiritimatiellia bacterium]|nr:DUF167 family protein [Kiritimatiellia bacterium]HMP32875.1 DUF167 family protein [Kiritimatiellia bacterium]
MSWLKATKDGVCLSVHLTPRASRDAIAGLHGTGLKVSIKAPPVDGKANAYLIAYIAKELGLPKSGVSLVRGETGRDKVLLVRDRTEDEIRRMLGVTSE